jgi:hypothetical protein
MSEELFISCEQFEEGAIRQEIALAGQKLNLASPQLERIQSALLRAVLNTQEYNEQTLEGARVPICIRLSLQAPPSSNGAGDEDSTQSWGYFIVNRLIDSQASLGTNAHHTIEIFLYPEGQS